MAYEPMTISALGAFQVDRNDVERWRLVAEFLEEFRHESPAVQWELVQAEPGPTGDPRWDVFLAALTEHVCARQDRAAPAWARDRRLDQFWFPFNTRAARADALVHSPVSFRRRGIFIAPQELRVA
jgi:hypothetical protein